jgi:hypothetical protein
MRKRRFRKMMMPRKKNIPLGVSFFSFMKKTNLSEGLIFFDPYHNRFFP